MIGDAIDNQSGLTGNRNRELPMRKNGLTLVELLVVIALITMLMALLLPAVQSARESARLITCKNNYRQVSLAVLGYTTAFDNRLPPIALPKPGNNLQLGWRVPILPFIEGDSLYRAIKTDEPWHSDANLPVIASVEPVFQCPSTPGFPRSFSQTDTQLTIDGGFEVGARDNHAVYVVEVPPSPTRLAGAWFSGTVEELQSGATWKHGKLWGLSW